MSAITGSSITKKRKKSDAKPQSQVNKCLNEKRRRTQENQYIDELAELVCASDMSSGKADKCQILQRTVDQIRQINNQSGCNSYDVQQGEVSSSNPNILSNDQVGPILLEALDGFLFIVNTEGRVEHVTENITDYINYTKSDVIGKDIYNIIHHGDHNNFMPNILPMSVAGWSSEPQSRNRTFECRFLVKPPDDQDETMEEKQQRVSKYETMLICSALLPSNGATNSGNNSNSNSSSNSSTIGGNSGGNNDSVVVPSSGGGGNNVGVSDASSESADIGPSVMCVARRISLDEKRIGQFTLKLNPSGKITAIDTSWLSPAISKHLLSKDLINTKVQDLCHPLDLNKLQTHLNDTLQSVESMSPMYRLRLTSDKFLNVQTKSKFFKGNINSSGNYEPDFIMATNSIFRDNDLSLIDGVGQLGNSPSNKLHSAMRGLTGSNNGSAANNNNNVGGPLMSVAGQLNGQLGTLTTASSGRSSGYNPAAEPASATFNHFNPSSSMDLEFDFLSNSGLELDPTAQYWSCERPDSRTSQTSVHQPQQQTQQQQQPSSRPPSQPNAASASPAATAAMSGAHGSPLRAFSPSSAVNAFSNPFPFSPLQETQTASLGGANTPSGMPHQQQQQPQLSPMDHRSNGPMSMQQQESDMQQQQQSQPQQSSLVSTESGRLRNLLTKGSSASEDSCQDGSSGTAAGQESSDKPSQTNRILKILLNQQDDDDYHSGEHGGGVKAVRGSPQAQAKLAAAHEASKANVAPGNNMLLQLLNEKNDDEDEESKAGLKKRNELLTQLLKDPEDEKKTLEQKNRDDDPLLRSLGFRNTSPSSSDHGLSVGQKRPVEDGDINIPVKRPMDGSQVSSSASSSTSSSNNTSKLWEKNRMLASLLAKQPTQPATIPPIPASVISATPQDKLPRVLDRNKQQHQQHLQHQQQHQQPWTNMQSIGGNATTTTSTSARTPMQGQSRQISRQPANVYLNQLQRSQMEQMDPDYMSNRDYRQQNADPSWDLQSSSADPDLSEILDQVIDIAPEGIADNRAIASLIDAVEAQRHEKLAINAIQESLMQIETTVNHTSSNNTMPGTPPAYSTPLPNTPVTSSHNYQPPPMYQQSQQQPRMRLNAQQAGIRQAAGQFTPQQQQQQQRKFMQQQQLKQRLLQQQQQQQLLIPSNATAPDQITTGIHDIDSLLNNTVAPNVSLQRSNVPDSQVSPNYGGSVQMPQGQHRLTHSYSHPSSLPQHPGVNNSFNNSQQVSATARLSPHSPAGMLPFSQPQPLSPRVTQQGNYAGSPRMFNVNQVRQQQQICQQPVMQQQRSMSSPGTPVSARQSPFPAEAFPPPASPTASQFPPGPNSNVTNPSAQYRLQRQTSTSSATTQLPGNASNTGGINSEYVRKELRTVVDARMQQQQQQQRIPNNLQNNMSGQVLQEDYNSLGLTYDIASADYYGRGVPR